MKWKEPLLFLAMGHGLNDLVAGYFLGGIVRDNDDIMKAAAGLIVYNVLAFGGQYPVALMMEKIFSPRKVLLVSYVLNTVAIVLFPFVSPLSIVLTGIASALYHVAGGTVSASQNKALHIGLFAAPGVVGLIAGGYFAYNNVAIDNWLFLCSILFLAGLPLVPFDLERNKTASPVTGQTNRFMPDQHDIIMMLLLTIISLRSATWNIFQLIHENNYEWLLAIAVSAFIGKIAGGWIADRIGWRLYMFTSLVVATPLLTIFKRELILFCIGIGLLQSGIPATTALLVHSMKGANERAVGLSFGATILAGAFFFYTPARAWLLSGGAVLVINGIMLLLMFLMYKMRPGIARNGINLA